MIHVLDSRLPYVVGILASTYAQLINSCTFQFDEVIIVDLTIIVYEIQDSKLLKLIFKTTES